MATAPARRADALLRLEVAADHQLDHVVVLDVGLVERAGELAVAQHHDAIGGLLDLVAGGAK